MRKIRPVGKAQGRNGEVVVLKPTLPEKGISCNYYPNDLSDGSLVRDRPPMPEANQILLRRPVNREIMNKIRNMKNRILAIPAAALTIPPKPKIAATIATIKKTAAQYNILNSSLLCAVGGRLAPPLRAPG